jgi:hypothetical protein
MYETREFERNGSRQIKQTLERERQQAENLAQELSRQSMYQWQKAIQGLVALPTAIAVGFAATALYAVGFLARGLEVFQIQAEEARRFMTEERQRMEEQPREGERRPGEGPRA